MRETHLKLLHESTYIRLFIMHFMHFMHGWVGRRWDDRAVDRRVGAHFQRPDAVTIIYTCLVLSTSRRG